MYKEKVTLFGVSQKNPINIRFGIKFIIFSLNQIYNKSAL